MISLSETLQDLCHHEAANSMFNMPFVDSPYSGVPLANPCQLVPFGLGPDGCVAPLKPPTPDRPGRLYMSLGVQRSGKSTLARRWLRREVTLDQRGREGAIDDGFPRFLWDTDALRLELHGKAWVEEAESIVFAIKRYAIATALRLGHDVFVAGTHTSRTSIRRLLEIRRDAIPVVVDTDVDTCLQRAIDTRQAYLLNVIPRTHRQLRELLAEGLDSVLDQIRFDIDHKVPY